MTEQNHNKQKIVYTTMGIMYFLTDIFISHGLSLVICHLTDQFINLCFSTEEQEQQKELAEQENNE